MKGGVDGIKTELGGITSFGVGIGTFSSGATPSEAQNVVTSTGSAQYDVPPLSINRSLGYRLTENASNRSYFNDPPN